MRDRKKIRKKAGAGFSPARPRKAHGEKQRISRKEARAWRKRWAAVNRAEIEELRRTTPEEKFRQLCALMESAKALGWARALAAEEAEVRERWMRLRKAYGGK